MYTRSGLVLIILLVVNVATSSEPLPVIIWHGMGDHAKGGGIRQLGEVVQQVIPGTKVKCIATSQSDAEDIEDSYFKPIDIQITQVCNELLSDPVFRDGVHMIGLSQGGLFVRALAQRCPFKTIGAVVSIGGPQMGVFGVPKCRDIGPIHWCFVMEKLLSYGAYSSLVQQHLVQAQYWHDPLKEETYREKCQFLPDINQERLVNSTYRNNLLKVKHLVLVRFAGDTVLKPKESEGSLRLQILRLSEPNLFIIDLVDIASVPKYAAAALLRTAVCYVVGISCYARHFADDQEVRATDTHLGKFLIMLDGLMLPNIRVRWYIESIYMEDFIVNSDQFTAVFTSSWFGYFDDMTLDKLHSLKETEMYKKDWLGLKRLDETGRLHFIEIKGDHMQFTLTWFKDMVATYIT